MAKSIDIGGRLHSTATGNIVTGTNEVYDDDKGKKQSEINAEIHNYVENINNALENLSPEQQEALDIAEKVNNNEAKLGYYVCGTESNVAAKIISDATGYVLSTGGSIKVKMTNANSANNATLNINSTGAKALYYDGVRASANNTWEAGETVEVYYDGTNFYANNVAGGGGDGVFDVSEKYPTSGVEGGNTYTLAGALTVLNTNLPDNKKKGGMSIKYVQSSDNKYVQFRCMAQNFTTDVTQWQGVDDEPTAGSKNLVKSGGVDSKINNLVQEVPHITMSSADLDLSDENDNVIARFNGGHIKTKKFDSENISFQTGEKVNEVSIENEPTAGSENLVKSGGVAAKFTELEEIYPHIEDCSSDLDISDDNGNVISRFSNGHIRTKNFDSSNIDAHNIKDKAITPDKLTEDYTPVKEASTESDLRFSDDEGNVLVDFSNGHIRTKNFDSSDIVSGIKSYNTLRDAIEDEYGDVILVGSQLAKHNTDIFTKPSSSITGANMLEAQYNYIGLNSTIPEFRRSGLVQTFTLNGVSCEIVGMTKRYIYVRDATEDTTTYPYPVINNNVVYRIEHSDAVGAIEITNVNYTIIDLTNKFIDPYDSSVRYLTKLFELDNLDLIVETKTANGSMNTDMQRDIFKYSLSNETATYLFKTPTSGQIWFDWGFSQYGNIVVMSPYGGGITAEIWLSQDYGDTFNCVFHVTNRTTNNPADWGDDIVPQPADIIPAQPNDFWKLTTNLNVHIHCSRYDPIDGRIYATMGDYQPSTDGYSAIWYSDDLGTTWHLIHPGGQCLIMQPLRNCMLIGCDGFGEGIFRYNRNRKEDTPAFELAYQVDGATPLGAVASASAVDGSNAFFTFAPSPKSSSPADHVPYGHIVWTDGYNFKKIYVDEFANGTDVYKIYRHNRMVAINHDVRIALSEYGSAMADSQSKEILILKDIY